AVREIDGNNMEEIVAALDALPFEAGRPSCVVAHTVKCKGLPFGEGKVDFHYWKPASEELDEAEEIIGRSIKELEEVCAK
ncbi:MAG: transketolase, partial [Oscillospiraceae bacterium]|nr:transketolase [Oscillospiraceae bacterium]